MEVRKTSIASPEIDPNPPVASLSPGTVFKMVRKLFLKTNGGPTKAVRLTSGEEIDFTDNPQVTEVVNGTFNYK